MRIDFVNPSTLIPTQQTDSGVPLLSINPIQFEEVKPAFNLPDKGTRPEDKHPKNKNPYQLNGVETDEDEITQLLPESFKLILYQQFHDVFKAFLDLKIEALDNIRRTLRAENGMGLNQTFSTTYANSPHVSEIRDQQHNVVIFYHYSRPGLRFKGEM